MTDSSTHDVSNGAANNNHSQGLDGLTELRSLLLGSELQERLENLRLRAEDVSRVLPEAIILRTIQQNEQNEQMTKAMVPTVEAAIETSVKKDFNVLADALFPVIGPATRKAVSAALKTLNQSLNQTLEHSLSPQSFKWRLEARQTGKTFAEVVLLRTLIYRVEQVLLIHKKTGLVLQHLVAETVAARDADLVSAMLTAIQDFVQDSFNVEKGDSLETLQFGELSIWIEQGPQAVLAGVIRGNAPQELRSVFQEALERIHVEQSRALDSFQGDNAPFEASRQYLDECLRARYKAPKETPSPFLKVLIGSIVLAIGFWAFVSIQERQRWSAYLEKLNAQPGIVVTTAEKRHGKYFISGLRDPLAVEPIALMKEANINPEKVISRWEPYLSFSPEFMAARAKQLLQAPQTVSLKVDKDGILYATGSAPRQWLNEAKKLAQFIPGITQFQTKNFIETELKQLELSKKQIEEQVIGFGEGSTQIKLGQNSKLKTLVREIKKLLNIASFSNKDVHIQIVGRANPHGSEEKNMLLSQARAYAVLNYLVSQGVKTTDITAVGVGAKAPLLNDLKQNESELNRSVTLKVFLTDASAQTSTNQ